MSGWRPIETAPMDDALGEPDFMGDRRGPWVLLWIPEYGIAWPARWLVEDGKAGQWVSYYTEALGTEASLYRGVNATHWMPAAVGPGEEGGR